MEMKFSGEFEVAKPRAEVFELLSDPQKFAPLLPTFQSLEMKDDRTATVRVKVGIGKIRGTASTELTLAEVDAPKRAKYVGQGKLMQGAYQMIAAFDLEDAGKGTRIKWQGETRLVGKILSLAGGGLRGYAEKEITKVIGSLQDALSPQAKAAAAPKAEGWLARTLRALHGEDEEAAAPAAPVAAGSLAPQPDDAKAAQEEARQRIAAALQVKRVEKKLARKEDARLVRGRGLFVDDYKTAGLLHMAVVRSPYAHARIRSIDVSRAEAMPGVVCTLTGKEVAEQTDPFMQIAPEPGALIKDYCLAVDEARFQGDPVVAVIAEDQRLAQDAAQLVEVDYETLPAVISCEQALEDKVLVHEQVETNRIWHGVYEYGDVEQAFADAAHVVKIDKLYFHRFGSTALETNACVANWDARGNIDLFCNTIMTIAMAMLQPALRVSMDQIRLYTHDIGGSFGNKICNYPYIGLAALASRKAGAPVKWVETRSEHMQAGGHGSERSYFDTEVALDKDGVITAIKSRHVDDCGAYPRYEPLGCVIWSQVLPASLKLRNVCIDFNQVVSNKGPAAPNRGYSRLPHIWFMERVLDICGHELGIPGDEMRLRNYIPEMPYTTPNGCVYDSGDFAAMLAKAKETLGWDEWKKKQAEARAQGRLIGIGIGTTLDSGANNFGQAQIINPFLPFSGNSEVSIVKLDMDGTVNVSLGTFPQGQGHETTTAQVVAEDLGIDPDMVHVQIGFDSARNSHSGVSGTYASQFAVTGLSAAHGAAVKLRDEIKKLAAFALEASEDDLEFGVGEQGPEVRVVGSSDRAINFWALSNMINYNNAQLPEELRELSLNCRYVYVPPFQVPDVEKKYGNLTLTYALQTHIAVVEVDPLTCQSKILDYAIVDDCGTVVNHMIVQGQVHGAAAHGIGAALLEIMPYDADGNVMSGSFTDYAPITIQNMPDMKCANRESPSPFSFNGAKGMGEGGGAPLHAISAALQDALYDEGIIIRNSHNSPMALFDTRASLKRADAVAVESR